MSSLLKDTQFFSFSFFSFFFFSPKDAFLGEVGMQEECCANLPLSGKTMPEECCANFPLFGKTMPEECCANLPFFLITD